MVHRNPLCLKMSAVILVVTPKQGRGQGHTQMIRQNHIKHQTRANICAVRSKVALWEPLYWAYKPLLLGWWTSPDIGTQWEFSPDRTYDVFWNYWDARVSINFFSKNCQLSKCSIAFKLSENCAPTHWLTIRVASRRVCFKKGITNIGFSYPKGS